MGKQGYLFFCYCCALCVRATHCFNIPSSSWTARTVSLQATTAEEDLALTRQVIMAAMGQEVSPSASAKKEPSVSAKAYYQPAVSDRPTNDLMIRAALGEKVETVPLWLFRQAGRHLPEYREYKESTGRNFLEFLDNPTDVAECTMQPLRRYDVDAAILFSDILVIAQALDIKVTMPGGVGIQVPSPLKGPEEVRERLPAVDETAAPEFVQQKLGHVIEAVGKIREQMKKEDISIPLIGFSAAPWTLLFYMVGGSSKKNTEAGVYWLENHTEQAEELLDLLTTVVIEYMSAQVEAGCHMLQIFEAMGMMIDDDNFVKFAVPCLERMGRTLKERFPDTPLMMFCRGKCNLNDKVSELGYFDVVTIDGSVDRRTARGGVADNITLQGNYDPAELILENDKTPESVRETARNMLQELGSARLIANLGEGLGGKEDPSLVQAFVDAIHEESASLLSL